MGPELWCPQVKWSPWDWWANSFLSPHVMAWESTHTHTRVCTHTHTHIHTQTHTCAQTHTHTHTLLYMLCVWGIGESHAPLKFLLMFMDVYGFIFSLTHSRQYFISLPSHKTLFLVFSVYYHHALCRYCKLVAIQNLVWLSSASNWWCRGVITLKMGFF